MEGDRDGGMGWGWGREGGDLCSTSLVDSIMAPKRAHNLIIRICYFADGIKIRILRWRYYPGLSSQAQNNHKGLSKGKREAGGAEAVPGDMTKDAEVREREI